MIPPTPTYWVAQREQRGLAQPSWAPGSPSSQGVLAGSPCMAPAQQLQSQELAKCCCRGSPAKGSSPPFPSTLIFAHPGAATGPVPPWGASPCMTQPQLPPPTESPSAAECHPLTQILPPPAPAQDLDGIYGGSREGSDAPSPSSQEGAGLLGATGPDSRGLVHGLLQEPCPAAHLQHRAHPCPDVLPSPSYLPSCWQYPTSHCCPATSGIKPTAAAPPGPPGTVVGLWESPALNLALPGGFPWDSRGGCVVWGGGEGGNGAGVLLGAVALPAPLGGQDQGPV